MVAEFLLSIGSGQISINTCTEEFFLFCFLREQSNTLWITRSSLSLTHSIHFELFMVAHPQLAHSVCILFPVVNHEIAIGENSGPFIDHGS